MKYELKHTLRTKDVILWVILFPIVLGTLFKLAFNSIYEKNTVFSAVPTVIVEISENENFNEVIEAVSGGDEPLLKAIYADEEKAMATLKNGDAEGIIYVGDEITLTVAESGMQETILKSFIEQYNVNAAIIEETLKTDPKALQDVIDAISDDVSSCARNPVTQGNTDMFTQYFYNLIAMVAIFGSLMGVHISKLNQANLSALGARKNCSPTPKLLSMAACLSAHFIAESICMIICVTYIAFVLRIDFGDRLPLVYGAAVLGGCMGVTMGFFIGSIGHIKTDLKTGITTSVSMILCFLSGLMVGNIKSIIAEKAPWFNQINPVAIISDSIYCLNLYRDFKRFSVKIISMLLYIVLFSVLGILLSRRKKYASL